MCCVSHSQTTAQFRLAVEVCLVNLAFYLLPSGNLYATANHNISTFSAQKVVGELAVPESSG
jgi:hypothetical protein